MDKVAKDYWDNRYFTGGNSGDGSYSEQLSKKLKWLENLDIQSISDIGCGDFNFGKNLLKIYPNALYVGQDISEIIINKNIINYPQCVFTTEIDKLPRADLVLCSDVLYHILDDGEYQNILNGLKSKWTKYLAITSYERGESFQAQHMKIRRFNHKLFGEPIIREIVEEEGQLYFYLFKKI